jgi:hypothetical protein
MNGKGVLYYKLNKPAYDGSWINGQFHGSGVLYNENPQYLSGEFNFSNFDEIGDYWRKYEGNYHLTQETSTSTTSAAAASSTSATVKSSRAGSTKT